MIKPRYKRIFCTLAACILLFCTVPITAEENSGETDNTYYENTFDDASFLDGAIVQGGSGGFVYVNDGALCFEASDTYPPVTTVLFPFVSQTEEYVIECDITLNGFLSGGSWASVVFGAQSADRLYQFTFRPDTNRSDSIQLMYKKSASAWDTLDTGTIKTDKTDATGVIATGSKHHFMLAVKGKTAFGYIDGELVAEARVNGDIAGRFGINGRGLDLLIDNLKVHGNLPDAVSVDDTFGTDVYVLKTGIAGAPSIIRKDTANTPVYTQDTPRAAVLMYTLKWTNDIIRCYDGVTLLGPLDDRYESNKDLVIPAFYISDSATASRLNEFLRENNINDAFVISQNASQIKDAIGMNEYIRGVLDMSLFDVVSVSDVYSSLAINGLSAVVLSEKAADIKTVTALRSRLISVWVRSDSSARSVFSLTSAGANGIITEDDAAAVTELELLRETTVMKKPVLIAHRGDVQNAPENSIRGFLLAASYGADAVSADVRMTEDGVPVLSVSDVTTQYSERLLISQSTVSQIKALTYSDYRAAAGDTPATLEELFEAVYRKYSELVLHLHLYDVTDEMISAVLQLADEYGMKEKTVLVLSEPLPPESTFSNDAGVLLAYSAGSYTWDPTDIGHSIAAIVGRAYSGTYYGNIEEMPARFLTLVRPRGITAYPWTADTSDLTDSCFISGYDGYSTDVSSNISKYIRSIDCTLDSNGRLSVVAAFFDGSKIDVSAVSELVVLGGDVRMAGGVVSGRGTFAVGYTATLLNGTKYKVYSEAKTIGVEEIAETTGGDEISGNDGAGFMTVVVISAFGICLAGGLLLIIVLQRKNKKN